jgi:protein-disulfide isomerase
MMKAWLLVSVILAASLAGARAAPLTPDQRAEVLQIVRQALRDDPSLLRDALTSLQADDTAQQSADAAGAIAAQHAALVADPADPVAGNPAGAVTVVEFYDPRCPYCRQMLPVLAALLKADKQVRLVLKDIPILGPASVLESRALLAAQRQGGYGPLQAALMRSPTPPTLASIRAEAEHEGLDGERLERDMADPAIQARLDQNVQLATALHIEGTPALIVGNHLIPGAVELAELQRAVAAASRP